MLLLLGMVAFLALGVVFYRLYPYHACDLRSIYYPTRCLLAHGDPYSREAVLQVYVEQGGENWDPLAAARLSAVEALYPPTIFLSVAPIAMLPWNDAKIAYLSVDIGVLLLACWLVWDVAAGFSAEAAGFLFFLLLINWEVLIIYSNVAAFVIGLSAIAVWSFTKSRAVAAGIVCLGLALALKPHDAGQVWLCLLLLGGSYRRRAMLSLLVLAVVAVPALFWVGHVSPHWLVEMRANIADFSKHGGSADPGPDSSGGRGIAMLVNLQTALSVVKDYPRFYNLATYLVCAPLIAFWGYLCVRVKPTARNVWFGLAAIAPLSMLPVYHRLQDVILLMLCIPACAMLWSEGRAMGKVALGVTAFSFCAMGFMLWLVVYHFVAEHKIQGEARILVGAVPVPLVLLAMSMVFLWIFWRRAEAELATEPDAAR